MKEAVRTVEGAPTLHVIDGGAQASPASPKDTMPLRVYSLDGLLALALAVQELEVTG